MFSRTLFRSFPRSIPSKLLSFPRPLPRTTLAPLRRQPFSQTPPRPRMRIELRRGPNYQQHILRGQNAKPLVTPEQLSRFIRGPQLKWLLVISISGGTIFYVSNLETVPVSGRRRFNCYNEEDVEAEGQKLYHAIMRSSQQNILPSWDRRTKQVERVMRRLIPASGLENVPWEIHVIDNPEANAFVIPGGKVFVLTGILPIAKNDDGLAAILGHEIAHNLAQHAAESMSSMVLLAPIRWTLIFLDSTGITGGLGLLLGSIGLDLGITKPASRAQESEADYIGLMMMAKSCYNPDEAVKVWERMEKFQAQQAQVPEWLSTHPSNSNRISQMQQWLAKADEARSESGCAATIQYSSDFESALGRFFK